MTSKAYKILVVLSLVLGFHFSYASQIYSQPDQSGYIDITPAGNGTAMFQYLGTNLSGSFGSLSLILNGGNAGISLIIKECDTKPTATTSYNNALNQAGCISVYSYNPPVFNSPPQVNILATSSTFIFNANKHYALFVDANGNNSARLSASLTGTPEDNTICWKAPFTNPQACVGGKKLAVTIEGQAISQNIRFTSPIDGTNLASDIQTVSIDYTNPNNFGQIFVCVYDPSTMYQLGGANPCEGGGSSYSISATGTILYEYVNTIATSTRVFSAGFGLGIDYIPTGIRYLNYDYTSVGFHTNAVYDSATGTPNNLNKYAGLDCGGFNISDNLKCAFIFLFYPDITLMNSFKRITLASSTPFSYLYSASPLITALTTGGSTTTKITMDLGGQNLAHIGSIVVFNTDTSSYPTKYQNTLSTVRYSAGVLIWLVYFYYVWRRVNGLIGK
jgi:hypothetical protein